MKSNTDLLKHKFEQNQNIDFDNMVILHNEKIYSNERFWKAFILNRMN